MVLSETFLDRVRLAIEELPDAALALFALWDSRNGAAVRLGAMAGARWVGAVNEYFPCVAIVLPRRIAEGFVAYGRERLGGWPDDILMHRYLSALGVPRYVAVPNLAEHEDRGSISGNAFRGPRRSVCFLPGDRSGKEGETLTGLTVLPFFKHGVAQCAVRVPGPGPEQWLHLGTEQYLHGAGLPAALLRPPGSRLDRAGRQGHLADGSGHGLRSRPRRTRHPAHGVGGIRGGGGHDRPGRHQQQPARRTTSPAAANPWPRWPGGRSRPGAKPPPSTAHAPGPRVASSGTGRRTRSANTSHAGWPTGRSDPPPRST